MAKSNRPLYAVLIDADNVPAKYAQAILKEISSFGEPALRRVYGDWSAGNLQGWAEATRSLGLVAHQESANTKGKNASDIGLVIDAMDILHRRRSDGFVLVSSDSDFTRLASRIREDGLDVIGMGERKAPESFVNACQRYIYLDNLEDDSDSELSKKADPRENPSRTVPIIRKAMQKLNTGDGWYDAGGLGSMIQRDNPAFDSRTYGFPKFSELLEALNEIDTKREGTSLLVRFKK